jgi:hypothetical protein
LSRKNVAADERFWSASQPRPQRISRMAMQGTMSGSGMRMLEGFRAAAPGGACRGRGSRLRAGKAPLWANPACNWRGAESSRHVMVPLALNGCLMYDAARPGNGAAVSTQRGCLASSPTRSLKLTGPRPGSLFLAALFAARKAAVVPGIHVVPRLRGPQLNARRWADLRLSLARRGEVATRVDAERMDDWSNVAQASRERHAPLALERRILGVHAACRSGSEAIGDGHSSKGAVPGGGSKPTASSLTGLSRRGKQGVRHTLGAHEGWRFGARLDVAGDRR